MPWGKREDEQQRTISKSVFTCHWQSSRLCSFGNSIIRRKENSSLIPQKDEVPSSKLNPAAFPSPEMVTLEGLELSAPTNDDPVYRQSSQGSPNEQLLAFLRSHHWSYQLVIGTTINGKYRILSLLGAGGWGDVYKAEQLNARGQPFREVALKFLKPEFSREPNISHRFLRELEVMARLDHPHTVTVYDSGETEAGYLYFTMKLIPGETLKALLERERTLPLDRAFKIATQVCEALTAAHEQSEPVTHRDLKPSNVFLEVQSGQE